jgi:hypothetical protein
MKKLMTVGGAALAALACTGSVRAHHSYLSYETTPIWVKGTVVRFEQKNPHALITLTETTEDGQTRGWVVEGPSQDALDRGIGPGVLPTVGDTLEFCAFPYKSVAELSRLWPGVDFSARRSLQPGLSSQQVAGRVMFMPDAKMRLWESHGSISECIRSSDERRQSWLDFINADPNVRQTWCEQRAFASRSSNAWPTASKEFMEEFNRSIDEPCG